MMGWLREAALQEPVLTLERSVGADVVITGLPSGGGAGGLAEENILLNSAQSTTATEHTLLEAIEAGSWYQIDLADASGARAQAFMSGAQILRTTEQSATPGTTNYFGAASARTHRVTNTSGSADTFFVWKSDEALKLWVRTAQLQDGMLNIFKLTPGGGTGMGGGTDTNDYVDALDHGCYWDHVDCNPWAHGFFS